MTNFAHLRRYAVAATIASLAAAHRDSRHAARRVHARVPRRPSAVGEVRERDGAEARLNAALSLRAARPLVVVPILGIILPELGRFNQPQPSPSMNATLATCRR